MTLVLPCGSEQIGVNSSFRATNMPCVFDGQSPLDFESALMTSNWSSDMSDYETPADSFCTKAPSDAVDLKRKVTPPDARPSHPKKARVEEDDPARPLQSEVVSSSSSSASSSSSSSSTDPEEEEEEEEWVPRRRGPQMWNSRQRWKDERKRVLKMSLSKLAEIEDAELCLHRSVVINNTVRRLHADIRGERQAKLRYRQQQRADFFQHFEAGAAAQRHATPDAMDESSCDEMFGVSEDFLRVTIPDRRVSSPVPSQMDTGECKENRTFNNSLSSCDNSADSAPCSPHRTDSAAPKRLVCSLPNGGSQCATQYRTGCDSEGSFPPRVPILDSVVYHSLLASLESS